MTIKDKNSVLIVDDEKANCIMISQILKNDYTVYIATNGHEAIDVAKKKQPDIILLDIMMPGLSGYEVLAVLKETIETKNIPVIFVTGLNNEEDEEKGLYLGAEDYITKPFSPAIVKLRVQKIIQTLNQKEILKQLFSNDQHNGLLCTTDEFHEKIKLMWNHARLTKTTLSVMLMHINNFDLLPELMGWPNNNIAINLVKKVIEKSFINSTGVIHRLGGPKFGIVLLDFDAAKSFDIASNIKKNVENILEIYTHRKANFIQVCIGLTSYKQPVPKEDEIYPEADMTVDDFITLAEQTFVTSKIRNKVVQSYKE
jgi:diguanylate cyclase (GGDEF)-like protein